MEGVKIWKSDAKVIEPPSPVKQIVAARSGKRSWILHCPPPEVLQIGFMTLACPTCRKKGEWFEGPFGPFCSERCKLVDLGKWFNAEHVISDPLSADHLQDYEALENGPELDRPENL